MNPHSEIMALRERTLGRLYAVLIERTDLPDAIAVIRARDIMREHSERAQALWVECQTLRRGAE